MLSDPELVCASAEAYRDCSKKSTERSMSQMRVK